MLSIVLATGAGLYILDIVDNFINNYGIVVIGLLEAVVVGWIIKPDVIRDHTNSISYFNIGKWWNITIKYITPSILGIMLVSSVIQEFKNPYGGYSTIETFVFGWVIVAFAIICAFVISKKPWKNRGLDFDEGSEE